jgi:hypothetical protein
MRSQSITRIVSGVVVASFWLAQQGWAQNIGPASDSIGVEQQENRPAPASAGQSQSQPLPKGQTSGTTVNPSEGPLQPVTTYPDAGAAVETSPKSSVPAQTSGTMPNAPQPKTQQSEPQGAATAEKVPVAGGAAAKPAGMAIAPAKQHRTRSLLIKVGALVAAGAAAGTVYALSRGTSSTPPGANSPNAVPK